MMHSWGCDFMTPFETSWLFLKFDTGSSYQPQQHLQSAPPASRGNNYQQPQMEQQPRPRESEQAGWAGENKHRLDPYKGPGTNGERTGISTTDDERQSWRGAINPRRLPGQKGYIQKPSDPFHTPREQHESGTQEYQDWNTSTGEKESYANTPWGRAE